MIERVNDAGVKEERDRREAYVHGGVARIQIKMWMELSERRANLEIAYITASANGTPSVTRHLTSVMRVCFRNKMITGRRTKFAFITDYEERSFVAGVLA